MKFRLPFPRKKRTRIIAAAALAAAAAVLFLPHLFHRPAPMPPGTHVSGDRMPVGPSDVRLLIDDTAWDEKAQARVIRQKIFDEVLAMIDRADSFIYLDLFLWNPWQGSIPEQHRSLSTELAEALIKKRRASRDIDIIVLTDPINRIYGGHEPDFFKDLAKVGIPVVFTDLDRLSDSNLLYSPYWRLLENLLAGGLFNGWARQPLIDNPFKRGGDEISLLQFGRMLLFKANHRKVVITGSSRHGLEMVVGSMNPADGSSAHSNMALSVKGPAALDALRSELEILRWSLERKSNVIVGATGAARFKADSMERKAARLAASPQAGADLDPGPASVQWLTEGAIREELVGLLGEADENSIVRIAMFYLSQGDVVGAIEEAVRRGASVRVVLDANRDAFGMKKVGVPNRPVASRLMALSGRGDISVRWADTHGEQFHTKAMSIVRRNPGESAFVTGSANWTRRNIDDLNLEANLVVRNATGITGEFNSWFDTIWENGDGLSHTLPYEAWEERGLKGLVKKALYHFQERWGAGTF